MMQAEMVRLRRQLDYLLEQKEKGLSNDLNDK